MLRNFGGTTKFEGCYFFGDYFQTLVRLSFGSVTFYKTVIKSIHIFYEPYFLNDYASLTFNQSNIQVLGKIPTMFHAENNVALNISESYFESETILHNFIFYLWKFKYYFNTLFDGNRSSYME